MAWNCKSVHTIIWLSLSIWTSCPWCRLILFWEYGWAFDRFSPFWTLLAMAWIIKNNLSLNLKYIYSPLAFPEYVPLVFMMDSGIPFYEAHLLKYFLNYCGDALFYFVYELVLVLHILVPFELWSAAVTGRRNGGWRCIELFSSFIVIIVYRITMV